MLYAGFQCREGALLLGQLKLSSFTTVVSNTPALGCLGAVCRLSSVSLVHIGCAGCSLCVHWVCPLRDRSKPQVASHLQPQGSIMCMNVGMVCVEQLTVQQSWLMRTTSEAKDSVQELAQLSPGKAVPSEQCVLLDDRRWNASCASLNNCFSPTLFFFSTFLPHLMLCSEVVGEAGHVYWCGLSKFLAGQDFLHWSLYHGQVSPVLCFHFLHLSWESLFYTVRKCGHFELVIRAKPGILGCSDRAGEGHLAFTSADPKGQCLHLCTGFRRSCCPHGAQGMQQFHGQEGTQNSICLGGREESGSHLWMQCGAVASSVSYTLWLDRSLISFNPQLWQWDCIKRELR